MHAGITRCMEEGCQTPRGVVSVPAGKTFLVSGGDFKGPCNGQTLFHIDGTLVASNDPNKLDNLEYWITFNEIDDLVIFGEGVFYGNGASSWSHCDKSSNCDSRPIVSLSSQCCCTCSYIYRGMLS